MFERFTGGARRVIVLSQDEARTLNHNQIATWHILLGLIGEGEGVAAKSLTSLGISLEGVRSIVEDIMGQGQQRPSGHIPFTPRAKKVIDRSLREALQLGHNYIGTEHILLALIRVWDDADEFQVIDVDSQTLKENILRALGVKDTDNDPGSLTSLLRASAYAALELADQVDRGDHLFRSLAADLARLSTSSLTFDDQARDLLLSYNITPKRAS